MSAEAVLLFTPREAMTPRAVKSETDKLDFCRGTANAASSHLSLRIELLDGLTDRSVRVSC